MLMETDRSSTTCSTTRDAAGMKVDERVQQARVSQEQHTPELQYTASAIVPCRTPALIALRNAASSAALALWKPGNRKPGNGLAAPCR